MRNFISQPYYLLYINQVSCILHEELDIDLKTLKTVVWGTAGRDIQVAIV